MTGRRLTLEQIAAHVAECDGCSICHGSPPTVGELEQLVQNVRVVEMFNGYPHEPSPAVQDLLNHVADMKAKQRAKSKPGQPRGAAAELDRERLLASRESFIARHGHDWGWLKIAAKTFNADPKTISSRIKAKS